MVRRVVFFVLCSIVVVLAFLPVSAGAFSRPYECQITGRAGAEASASECNGAHVGNVIPGKILHEPASLSVDASGDLWIEDRSAGLIDKFDSSGDFVAQSSTAGHWSKGSPSSLAFGDAANLLYASDTQHGAVWELEAEGTFKSPSPVVSQSEFEGSTLHVAVDNSGGETGGDFYVASTSPPSGVFRFSSAGEPVVFSGIAPYLSGNRLIPAGSAGAMAVDSSGDIYVADTAPANKVVREFAPSGLFVREFVVPVEGPFLEAVAVDPVSGDVLVVDQISAAVYEFESSGAYLGKVSGTPAGSFSAPKGIAVDANGRLYVADSGHQVVDVFGPPAARVIVPVVSTGGASAIGRHTAVLNGTVDPEGVALSECAFEYGETAAYGQRVGCVETPAEIGSGTGPVSVHAEISGLSVSTPYHFRLAAANANGTAEGNDEVFSTLAALKVSTGQATATTATTVTLSGAVDPAGEPVSDCHFEYAAPGGPVLTAPCTPSPGGGSGEVQVQASVSALTAGTEYAFRVVATNADGTGVGAVVSFLTSPAVKLATGEASDVQAGTATLSGAVDPQGGAVSDCHFEYGVEYAYDHTAPCAPAPGEGSGETQVHADITGLSAGETYEFRLVAGDADGQTDGMFAVFSTPSAVPSEAACPNSASRGETGSALLGDCRAFEMVSPQSKNGADIAGIPSRTRVAVDGDAVTYMSLGGFADAQGSGIATEYMAERTVQPATSGWVTHAITPGGLEPGSAQAAIKVFLQPRYMGELSSDLNQGVFLSNTELTHAAPDVTAVSNLYLRADLRTPGTGSYRLLTDCPGCRGPLPEALTLENEPVVAGASSDFSHVIFESEEPLTVDTQGCTPSGSSTCPYKLYEWASGGTVRAVGWIPPAGESECGTGIRDACLLAANSQAGRGAASPAASQQYTPNTISQDGSRIIFTVLRDVRVPSRGRLYMRVDNGLVGARTVQLNASERAVPASVAQDAMYWGASADGSKVLFTTNENLIDSDNTTESTPDLYQYDLNAPPGHRLALLSSDAVGGGAVVEGVLGESNDGGAVYFVAARGLTSDSPPGCDSAGISCIFRWHAGTLQYVAMVSREAVEDLISSDGWLTRPLTSRVSPDGNHLLFVSQGTEGLPHSGVGDSCFKGCFELFLYDANANGGAGSVVCASCSQPDGPAYSNASFISMTTGGASLTSHLSHPMSDDGRFVFFDTADALVTQDTNGVRDVYEYDSLTGELHLISTGESMFGSTFADASPDGSNAFFVTGQAITGWDRDGSADLYDARVGGGVPNPPSPPPSCQGDACQPPPLSVNDTTPASASFAGPGNSVPLLTAARPKAKRTAKRCGRGATRRKGRCVRRRPARKATHRAVNQRRGGHR